MGNIFSKKKYCHINAKKLKETPFSCYTEVSSTLRNTIIESVSDETCGSASNLLKVEEPSNEFSSTQEESRDGWIVKRHTDIASVTIRFCEATYVFGFDIDTTGFENICPTHALIEGLKTPIEENNEEWITLVDTESITPNSHNFFQKNNSDKVLYSHVRLTISPGGGIARFRTYGDVVPYYLNPETEYNLASASLGARIVHWTDTKSFNEPNVLLDKGTLITHGWLTPRSGKTDRNDFIVIQLAVPGSLNSIIIDTTGFKGISPLQVRVEGCDSKEDDPYLDLYTQWFSLVPKSSIKEDALNTFEVPYTDTVSHVRLTLLPDGGLQQIKCLGTVSNNLMLQNDSAKSLPSAALCEQETSTSKDQLDSDIEMREASVLSEQEENSPAADTGGFDFYEYAANIPGLDELSRNRFAANMQKLTEDVGKRAAETQEKYRNRRASIIQALNTNGFAPNSQRFNPNRPASIIQGFDPNGFVSNSQGLNPNRLAENIQGPNPNQPPVSYLGICNNMLVTPSFSRGPNYIQPSFEEYKQTPLTFRESNHTPPASQKPSRASSLEEVVESKKMVQSNTIIEDKSTMESLLVCKDKYTQIPPHPINTDDSTAPKKKRKADDDDNANNRNIPRRRSNPERKSNSINLGLSTELAGPAVVKKGRGRPRKNKK